MHITNFVAYPDGLITYDFDDGLSCRCRGFSISDICKVAAWYGYTSALFP